MSVKKVILNEDYTNTIVVLNLDNIELTSTHITLDNRMKTLEYIADKKLLQVCNLNFEELPCDLFISENGSFTLDWGL